MKCWSSFFDYSTMYWTIAVIMSRIKTMDSCVAKSYSNGSIRCCYNFVEVNGVCERCPTGYIGVNCTERCSGLVYGYLCSLKCDCSALDCDYVDGCPITTGTIHRTSAGLNKSQINRGNYSGFDVYSECKSKYTTRRILEQECTSGDNNNIRDTDIGVSDTTNHMGEMQILAIDRS